MSFNANNLRQIFHQAVRSVHPKRLIAEALHYDPATQVLRIHGDNADHVADTFTVSLAAGKRCHLVGFGKAALGMAVQTERILGDRLASGILSVPFGAIDDASTADKFANETAHFDGLASVIEIYEGAADNLPDDAAARSAQRILQCCEQLTGNDILLVLVSGGGSALLSLPVPPVTVAEKRQLCRSLSGRGATIDELNAVRVRLSMTKGGKLAVAARRAAAIVTLVISDVCGDKLDVIASGPTLPCRTSAADAWQILTKYQILENDVTACPQSIRKILEQQLKEQPMNEEPSPTNCQHALIVGNNRTACQAALAHCTQLNYLPIVISTQVHGNVATVAKAYVELACAIYAYRWQHSDPVQWQREFSPICRQLDIDVATQQQLRKLVEAARSEEQREICLIFGGEPTVRLASRPGRGGRSQELALRVSQLLHGLEANAIGERVMVLCAGTDGFDGPNAAAGAIGCASVARNADATELQACVDGSDSFGWYEACANGDWHIRTGHTGTNVMDLHLLLVG